MRSLRRATTPIFGIAILAILACSPDDVSEPSESEGSSQPRQRTPASSADEGGPAPASDESTSVAGGADILSVGRDAFQRGRCSMCHDDDGTGTKLGPNLTTGNWRHCDGTVEGIRKVLMSGIPTDEFHNPSYSMPMKPVTRYIDDEEQITALATYIRSLAED